MPQSLLSQKIVRRLILYTCAFLAIFTVGSALTRHRHTQADSEHDKLRAIADRLVVYELSDNSLSLHYNIRNPEKYHLESRYGLSASEISLPIYTRGSAAEAQDFYANIMTDMSHIKTDRLSTHDRQIFRVLEDILRSADARLSFPYYGEPLSPSSGEQTSLLILLAEYRIDSCRDAEDYLKLLACVGDYLDGLLLYEQEKAAAGLFMSRSAAEKVIIQCDTLCTERQIQAGTHFLQTTFRSRLQVLYNRGDCSEDAMQEYLAQNDALLAEVVCPAYARLADGLFLLKEQGGESHGLCYSEQGKDYYCLLLSSQTGSARTPEEIMTLLSDNFSADYEALCETAAFLQRTLSDSPQLLDEIPYLLRDLSPEEMTEDLRGRMQSAFPALGRTVEHEIEPVDEALCEYTSPAFYMVPAVDDYSHNSIRLNYSHNPDPLTLYTTLAHEGYPGHLYQCVFHLCDMDASSLMPLEGMLSYGGYAEGWATYVEDLAYEFAAQAMTERSDAYPPEIIAAVCDFYRLDRRIQLCLYSILDLSIHYYGMTPDEAANLLGAYGITDTSVINSVYEYIAEEPANYLKYYLGYLEIVSLKNGAKQLWGNAYSDLRFHTFFLQNGPAPFTLLADTLSGMVLNENE